MATNLVSLVMQFLTPDMVGRSASSTPKTARGYGADRQDWRRSRQLTAEQRKAIAAVINPLMPAVNQACDKVLAIPAAEVLKPSVDTLKARLTAFVT
jgi:hypothetical protein